jgi:hypothetical protein
MNADPDHPSHDPGGVSAQPELTIELVLAKLESELRLALDLEKESELRLAMAMVLASDLEPELRKVLVSESLKAKQMASDWVKEMESHLAKAKAQGSQNC